MKKLTLLLTAALLTSALPACSGKSEDKPTTIETKALPTIDMVATHDINLDFPVAQLTFVPNSVAPWLGRIILLDDAGRLYSTDIEGRDPKPVGSGKYIDIFGLAREAAPGVFLAITANNQIEAFIESNDDGNFSPMIYAGDDISPRRFCIASEPTANILKTITTNNEYKTAKTTLSDNSIEQRIIESVNTSNDIVECGYNSKSGRLIWQTMDNKNQNRPNVSVLSESGSKQSNSKINSAPAPSINGAIENVKTSYHFFPRHEGLKGIFIISENNSGFNINIKNGLSVRGVERIKHVATTQSNYGGGAYAGGVLALVDADENRIVFISLSYAERQLQKAVNPPNNVTEKTPQ